MGWPWRRKAAPAAPQAAAVDDRKKPASALSMSMAAALARAAGTKRPRLAGEPAKEVFSLPRLHPPTVGKGGGGSATAIAQDAYPDGVSAVAGWGNAWLQTFGYLGTSFVGYPVLAELATRPEYRMIAETFASEMTRKWIRFRSKSTDDGEGGDDEKAERIQQLEDAFERLGVRDVVRKAFEQDCYYGRAHVYVDTGDTDDHGELAQPLGDGWDSVSEGKVRRDEEKDGVTVHGIRALRTVEAVWCYPTNYDSNNPLKPDWYSPEQWYVMKQTVHRTRLLKLVTREVPDILKPTYSFGGVSMSQLARPYVENWLQTRQSVNDIINAFSVFVLATDLGQQLQGDGAALVARATLFNELRDNRGLMMIAKDQESFQNVSAPLSGLHELQSQTQEHMCAVAHTPTVKLLGVQPQGFNADSEGVLRSYYDWIAANQEAHARPLIHPVVGLVMCSLWGEPDPDIVFDFVPLWALTEKEQAELEKLKAERDQILVDLGAIHQEESRARVAKDEGDFADIDVDDVPDLKDEEEEEEEGLVPRGGGAATAAAEGGGRGPEKEAA